MPEARIDDLLTEFLAETAEQLAALDAALIRLERTPADTAPLADAFRVVHTIKGNCGFFDLPRMANLSHAMEDRLGAVREGLVAVTPAIVTNLLAGTDRLRALAAAIVSRGTEPEGDDAALLARFGAAESPLAQLQPADAPMPDSEDVLVPSLDAVRIPVSVLETLMALVGELVLTRNQLLQAERVRGEPASTGPFQRLSHLVSDLQQGIMQTRMQPIRLAWGTVPRLVRDLSAALDKPLALVMRGEETELDRFVLETIRAPIVHMVRNCADHGIEAAAARLAAGKPATGTITLDSYPEGGTIVVRVADDGGGLDTDRIRQRAASAGLAPAAELASWTDAQLHRLILEPGFTTASAVTRVSGRGVGMDVVRESLTRIGGNVEIASDRGRGTAFTLRIPLTLAITSALIVGAGGHRFALPQTCVTELLKVGEEDGRLPVESLGGAPMLRLRDRLLPLVSLARLLGLPEAHPQPAEMIVIAAQVGPRQAGIVVDALFDTEEVVIKPLSRLLRGIPLFSGNAILGDGGIVMILDPGGLADAIGAACADPAEPADAAPLGFGRQGPRSGILLFRPTQGGPAVAAPLTQVHRIETLPITAIERHGDRLIAHYRDRLMILIALAPLPETAASVPVVVLAGGDRPMGLAVAELIDVVDGPLCIELGSTQPGTLGTALIAGRVADVLDTEYWIQQARPAGAGPESLEIQALAA